MKNLIFFLFFILIANPFSPAQTELTGDASARIDSMIKIMPATSYTDEYIPLNEHQAVWWGQVINDILNGDLISADAYAREIGYGIIIFTDTAGQHPVTYYFLEKDPDSPNYWGTLVFNPNPARSRLIIQAPHPLADTYTGRQAFDMFKKSGAFLYCVSGAHRCNSSDSSSCTGRTDVCIGLQNAKYRKSDQAHNLESVFQVTTEVLLHQDPEMIFVQLHGFTREEKDPDLILSNGTRYTPKVDYIIALRNILLEINPQFRFKITHIDWNWTRLTGTSNTQGRIINGSSNPCYSNALSASGNFLHIEQTPYFRIPENWNLMNDAIMQVIPADPFLFSLAFMKAERDKNIVAVEWETIIEDGNYGFELQRRVKDEAEWTFTGFISGYGYPGVYKFHDQVTTGDILYYRLKQINIDGTSKILPQVVVNPVPVLSPVLYDNYPNPFNASTIISFEIPHATQAELSLYNILGEKIKTLTDGILNQGMHKINLNAADLPAGIYFYRLTTSGYSQTKKLILLK